MTRSADRPAFGASCALRLVVALAFFAGFARAQDAPSATQVKAALLFNFARYVEWPPGFLNNEEIIVFGVLGPDSFREIFSEMISGKSIAGKRTLIRHFRSTSELEATHILFISSETERANEAIKALQGQSVLTVSDMNGFLGSGGMINFVTRSDKVRFEINARAAGRSGIKISSALLALADKVIR